MFTVPSTLRVKPALFKTEAVAPFPIVRFTHVSFAVSVIVCPAAITTSSVANGATPPTQVAPVLQFPVPAEVFIAAFKLFPANKERKRRNRVRL